MTNDFDDQSPWSWENDTQIIKLQLYINNKKKTLQNKNCKGLSSSPSRVKVQLIFNYIYRSYTCCIQAVIISNHKKLWWLAYASSWLSSVPTENKIIDVFFKFYIASCLVGTWTEAWTYTELFVPCSKSSNLTGYGWIMSKLKGQAQKYRHQAWITSTFTSLDKYYVHLLLVALQTLMFNLLCFFSVTWNI